MSDKPKKSVTPPAVETISELVENEAVFASDGFSHIKVTRAGKEKFIKLPIRSTGVAEYQQKLSDQAPRPPITKQHVKRNSPDGKAMGLPHDQICLVFDTTDEAYIAAQEEHAREFAWKVAVFALNLKWTKADGKPAVKYEDKKRILQNAGITGHQIDQIYKDVQELTAYAEDRIDFLSGN